MITLTAREIIRNAEDLSNSTNSAFLNFNLKTSLLNREYRKLYDQIVQGSLDFTKEITVNGGVTQLPCDCYQIISVTSGGIPLTRSGIVDKYSGDYYVENDKIHLPSGNYKITYSVVPDTITAPDKAVEIESSGIPIDGKPYFCFCDKDGNVTFKENTSQKYLNKSFTFDLSTEKINGAYKVGDEFYDGELDKLDEPPAGQVTDEHEIGKITIDDAWYYRDGEKTKDVVAYEVNGQFVNEDFSKATQPEGVLKEHTSIGLFKKAFHSPTIVNIYSDGVDLYTATLASTTEPAYTTKATPVAIGNVRKYDGNFYMKKATFWYKVTGFSPKAIYTEYEAVTDTTIVNALEALTDITISYIKYEQGTLLNNWIYKTTNPNVLYFVAESLTNHSQLISDQFDIAYLETLTFDEYFEDTYTDYSNYYPVIEFTIDSIKHSDMPVEDVDKILALDAIDDTPVICYDYVEQIDQVIMWDDEDALYLLDRAAPRTEQERLDGIKKDVIITNIQYHSPYMMVTYSDGVICIYTGFKRAIWNYNCITGHDTVGEIVALNTNDITGFGCVWHNFDDDKFYYAPFVPDTVLSYPTSALFAVLEYRLATILCGMLGADSGYIQEKLLPEAEQNFYSTLHFGNVATPMNNFNPTRWRIR